MNRYEQEVFEEAYKTWLVEDFEFPDREHTDFERVLWPLFRCIKRFRAEPQGTPVEDGFGAMVDKGAK